MRILFAIDTWALIGGTERHAAVVVPALVERGHEVVVLCREASAEGLAPGVRVIELSGLEGDGLSADERGALTAVLSEVDPEVIFLSALRNLEALALLTDAAPLVRYVHDHTLFCPGLNKFYERGGTCRHPMGLRCLQRYWFRGGCTSYKRAMHQSAVSDPLRGLFAKRAELRVAQRSARVLTNSGYMRAQLLQVGFDPQSTEVLHYFTRSNTPHQPPGDLPPEVEAFLADGEGPLIFTPARLTLPDKGVDYLLTVLSKLKAPFRALVSGDGPARGYLEDKARTDGVSDRVHFAGWLSSGPVETLFARADVVVCPSIWDEPFGLVGLEAMAHGKPVVAFDVGGISDWLSDGQSGFLLGRLDVDGMAAAVDRLLGDPQLAQRLGRRGAEIVRERFTPKAHLKGLEAALAAASGAQPQPAP